LLLGIGEGRNTIQDRPFDTGSCLFLLPLFQDPEQAHYDQDTPFYYQAADSMSQKERKEERGEGSQELENQ
jgi:hypothetical protein